MTEPTKTRAADHLIDQLAAQGARHIFGVPGESFLPLLDALHDRDGDLRFVTCRQEGGAAMAAEAQGKLTGRPGIAMVTRGPGATNASAGVHIAYQDSTPMILFIGQVARSMVEREAFQEIDYRRMFGQMAKWVAEIDDASRIQEYVSRAYRVAMSGRKGPVVLSLPEDMLYDEIAQPPAPRRIEPPKQRPDADDMALLQAQLTQAQNPLVIVGGSGWTPQACADLQTFAERTSLPVAASFRCQDILDNRHANYVGHFSVARCPYLADALEKADLLVVLGARLGEITTCGYTLLKPPVPDTPLVHVYPQGEEIGRVYEPEIGLVSDMESFCAEAAKWTREGTGVPPLRAAFEAFVDASALPGDPLAGPVAWLSEALPDDAIICNGAGNYAAWLNRFYTYRKRGTQLAPTSGSMGYGLPAALGAATAYPEREVFAVAGDGCFLMTCQEMATAAQERLDLTVIVINNGRYGTIRAHQEREYPGRVSGTDMVNPDFCAFARSFGAWAVRCGAPDDFALALAQARGRQGLRFIEVMQDPGFIAPGKRL